MFINTLTADDKPTLIISKILDPERRGFLNFQNVFPQNTIRQWTC